MTNVAVYSYAHSVTYVADNILKSFKDIIRLSGLDPSNLVEGWDSKMRGLTTWLASGHLERVVWRSSIPRPMRWSGGGISTSSTAARTTEGFGPTRTRSNTTSARLAFGLAKHLTGCCFRTNLDVLTWMDGDLPNIGPQKVRTSRPRLDH
jgi:hypothetical protein